MSAKMNHRFQDAVVKCGHEFGKKEMLLNYTMSRYQLNRPPCVGEIMSLIRQCQPSSLEDWDAWYFANAKTKGKNSIQITRESIHELGERLYAKLTEFVIPEMQEAIATITQEDCIDYVYNLVIRRTYDGYVTEKSIVTDKLQHLFPEVQFEESDPELDHAGDVDYVASVGRYKFGIQVKPITIDGSIGAFSVSSRMRDSFERFSAEFGGKVFIVKSRKKGDTKEIANEEVVGQIRAEIERLKAL